MRYLLAVALFSACTDTGNKQMTAPPEIGKRAVELCGQPPAEPDPDYHYWAAYQMYPNDPGRYAILHEINWKWMVDYTDALQAWRDCVVSLD